MELLNEIKKLKSPVRFGNTGVANPQPYADRALNEVQGSFEYCCRIQGISYAELLESLACRQPTLFSRYWQLADAVDCDVFGKWCDGKLTSRELEKFIDLVEQWKTCAKEIVNAFESDKQIPK